LYWKPLPGIEFSKQSKKLVKGSSEKDFQTALTQGSQSKQISSSKLHKQWSGEFLPVVGILDR
jgi:hypothetical protein